MKNSEEFKRRNGYSHMVLDYYVERVKERREERNRRLGEIKNRKQAEHYREYVRGAIRKAFSPLPDRTPLNPLVTGVMERPGYRMEKVIFESRPNCFVTGNLYIPEKIDKDTNEDKDRDVKKPSRRPQVKKSSVEWTAELVMDCCDGKFGAQCEFPGDLKNGQVIIRRNNISMADCHDCGE